MSDDPNKCDICPEPPIAEGTDDNGRVYRACKGHKKHLRTWIRSMNAEYASENAAAARYEREYE